MLGSVARSSSTLMRRVLALEMFPLNDFEILFPVLISILPSKILNVAALDFQTSIICKYLFQTSYRLRGPCYH